jgi:hypothetical protein
VAQAVLLHRESQRDRTEMQHCHCHLEALDCVARSNDPDGNEEPS